jgi:hypothetical protein
MFSWLKANLGTIIGGIAGSLATAFVGVLLASAPDGPMPSARVSWINVPWNIGWINRTELLKQAPVLEKVFQTAEIPNIINDAGFRDLNIFTINIKNTSEQVTKEVQVIANDMIFSAVSTSKANAKFVMVAGNAPVKIPMLVPGESAELVLVTKELILSAGPSVRILHNGRLVKPTMATFSDYDDPFGITSLIIRYTPLSQMLVIGIAAFLLFLVGVGIWVAAINNNFPSLARHTGKPEKRRIVRFADYIREHHKDELTEALREPPRPAPTLSTSDKSVES